jgi:hypothetical protein
MKDCAARNLLTQLTGLSSDFYYLATHALTQGIKPGRSKIFCRVWARLNKEFSQCKQAWETYQSTVKMDMDSTLVDSLDATYAILKNNYLIVLKAILAAWGKPILDIFPNQTLSRLLGIRNVFCIRYYHAIAESPVYSWNILHKELQQINNIQWDLLVESSEIVYLKDFETFMKEQYCIFSIVPLLPTLIQLKTKVLDIIAFYNQTKPDQAHSYLNVWLCFTKELNQFHKEWQALKLAKGTPITASSLSFVYIAESQLNAAYQVLLRAILITWENPIVQVLNQKTLPVNTKCIKTLATQDDTWFSQLLIHDWEKLYKTLQQFKNVPWDLMCLIEASELKRRFQLLQTQYRYLSLVPLLPKITALKSEIFQLRYDTIQLRYDTIMCDSSAKEISLFASLFLKWKALSLVFESFPANLWQNVVVNPKADLLCQIRQALKKEYELCAHQYYSLLQWHFPMLLKAAYYQSQRLSSCAPQSATRDTTAPDKNFLCSTKRRYLVLKQELTCSKRYNTDSLEELFTMILEDNSCQKITCFAQLGIFTLVDPTQIEEGSHTPSFCRTAISSFYSTQGSPIDHAFEAPYSLMITI